MSNYDYDGLFGEDYADIDAQHDEEAFDDCCETLLAEGAKEASLSEEALDVLLQWFKADYLCWADFIEFAKNWQELSGIDLQDWIMEIGSVEELYYVSATETFLVSR